MISSTTLIIILFAIIIFIVGSLVAIYLWESKMNERLEKGGKKNIFEKILFWDPPWALSNETIAKLEARSTWWKVLTVPAKILKGYGNDRPNQSTGFLFIFPLLVLAILIIWLVQTYWR